MEVQNRFRVIMIFGIFYLICIVHTSGTYVPQQCRINSEVPLDRVHLKMNSGIGILKRTGGLSEDKTESLIVGTGTLIIVGVAVGICCYYSRRWLCHCFYPDSVPVMRRSPLVSNPYGGQGHHIVYHTFPSCTSNKATATRPASAAYNNGVRTGGIVDGYTALSLESYKNEKINDWASKQNDMTVFPPDSEVPSTSASLSENDCGEQYVRRMSDEISITDD